MTIFFLLLIVLSRSLLNSTPSKIITDGFIPNPAYNLPGSQCATATPPLPPACTPCSSGDQSACRLFDVYLPPDYDPSKSYPIVYHLGGLGSNYAFYSADDQIVMDQMISSGQITPLIIIFPDGASQQYQGLWYVNSDLQGQFESYMVEQLIPYVNKKYNQKTDPQGNAQPFRAIMGQSMGGYGSLYYGIKHPELFCAFAGDSPTSFWVIYTDLASPDGNPMYTFNKLAIPELSCYCENNLSSTGALINSNNGYNTFSIFTWSAAFSPNTGRCYPYNVNLPVTGAFVPPADYDYPTCTAFGESEGGFNPVFKPEAAATYTNSCTGAGSCTTQNYNGNSLIPNPSALSRWPQFDPYALIDNADKEVLKRQLIYLDGGNFEYIDNVGARYFSDKLTSFNINNEYLLYGIGYTGPASPSCSPCTLNDTGGEHSFCTALATTSPCQYTPGSSCYSGSNCYRFTTNLKLFSGKFAENGYYAPDISSKITGTGCIELYQNSSILIQNIVEMGTLAESGAQTDLRLKLYDGAQVIIGGDTAGALQVGNSFGKAQLVNKPGLMDNKIDFSLILDGKDAAFLIAEKGFLGFAVGVNGNQTPFSNYWALSTLANTADIKLDIKRGSFVHNQIASALTVQSSLIAFGNALAIPRSPIQPITSYSLAIDPLQGVIKGGGNIAKILDSNYIHPTVLTTAGTIEPGGIRHNNLINPTDPTDDYPGNPVPYYKHIGSQTFYRNLLEAQILASSEIVALNNPAVLNRKNMPVNTVFSGLSLTDYTQQKVKSVPSNNQQVDYVTAVTSIPTITRTDIAKIGLASQSALGIKLIPNTQTILATYDLNP